MYWAAIPLIALILIPSAYGVTRDDLALLKDEVADARQKIIEIDEKIAEQKEKIAAQDGIIAENKQKLKDAKDKVNDSWDALKSIQELEKTYNESLKELQNLKRGLVNLFDEKNIYVKLVKDSEKTIPKMEREINRVAFDKNSITKLVGIQLSKSCITMIENNIPNNCPTYEQLAELDTSRIESGEFVTEPYFHRGPAKVENSWRIYDTDPTPRIIVDPPNGMTQRIHMIFIQSNQGIYFLPEDMRLENHTRTWHEHRYIEDCKRAYIDINDWRNVLVDTIYTLHNGCTSTTLKEINHEVMPYTDIYIGNTTSWKYKEWIEETKERCKGLCFDY